MVFVPMIAGMPVPMWVLTQVGARRLEAISFFLMVILLSAWCTRLLWNRTLVEAFGWPRIDFRRSLAVVTLWGAASVVVLTMISGARELMTPGAWEVNGATYRLADGEGDGPKREDRTIRLRGTRRDRLVSFWRRLGPLADESGRFPPRDELAAVDWTVPEHASVEYVYRGASITSENDVLVLEPRVYDNDQLVLRADGRVERVTPETLARELAPAEDSSP